MSVKPSTPEPPELIPAEQLKTFVYKKVLVLPIEQGVIQGDSTLPVLKNKDAGYFGAKVEKALLEQGFQVISSEIVARAEKSLGKGSASLSPTEKALVLGKESKADAVFHVQALNVVANSDFYTVDDLKTIAVDPSRVKKDRKGRLYNEETEECVFRVPYFEIQFEAKMIDARNGDVLWVGTGRQDAIDGLEASWVARLDKKCEMVKQNFVFSDYVTQESTLDRTFNGLLARLVVPLKTDAFAGQPLPSDTPPPPPPPVEKKPEPPPPPPKEEPKPITAVVTTNKASVRAGPGNKNDRVGYASRKTKVVILETMGEWSKVQLQNGTTGWMHESTIIVDDD